MSTTEKLPLSPMLFQYLVGLYSLKHGSEVNYHVTLGDMVADEASDTLRDVDVTVTTPDGVYGFAGYEVKHWSKKLDVSHVEALAAKLNDMPTVTQRAIVCSSGYTEPAISKAEYHGVNLYVIKEWTTPVEDHYPDLAPMKGPPLEVFRGSQFHLTWLEHSIYLDVDAPYFDIAGDTTLFNAEGKQHPVYPTFGAFASGMLVVSSDFLCLTKPMQDRLGPVAQALQKGQPIQIPDIDPRWSFGHTFEVAGAEVYVRASEALHRVNAVTIDGQLSWVYSPMLYLAMEKVPTGEMFASALVGVSPVPGRMTAIMIPTEGRDLSIRHVLLSPDQLNIIKQLELVPESTEPPE